MQLILWRHAEAEDGMPDLARRLTPAGRRDAGQVGAWLDAHLPGQTRIIVSPAQRALETVQFLRRPFETENVLAPGCTVDDVLACARWPGSRPVLVVGHQPTLGAAIARLVGGPADGYRVQPAAAWWLVRREGSAADVRVVLAPEFF